MTFGLAELSDVHICRSVDGLDLESVSDYITYCDRIRGFLETAGDSLRDVPGEEGRVKALFCPRQLRHSLCVESA